MNIGMILDTSFPPDPRVENEAQSLLEDGHPVFLFCLDYTHKQPLEENLNGIEVRRQHLPSYLYRFSALAYTTTRYHAALEKRIHRFIEENEIEALHIHDLQVARAVFSANRKHHLPVTLDLHENRPEIMQYYPHVRSLTGKLLIKPETWRKYEYRYIQEADRVIVVTEEAREHYVEQVPSDADKFYVVPNSVRADFYENYKVDESILSRYQKHFTLLYLGETGLRRGLDTLISSLRHLIPAIPSVKIVIVGKSRTDPELHNLVRANRWEAYVDFEGWKDPSLFPSYILASRAGISPLHRNLHHDTTYANKVFQYLAFGLPAVVSDCTAQSNLVGKYECGMVFEDRNELEFAKRVITLQQNTDLYQQLSDNAKWAIREHLNWDKLSGDLKTLYRTL